jgi:hypothetical protein
MLRQSIGLALVASALEIPAVAPQTSIIRTADPNKRSSEDSDIPRTTEVAASFHTPEDFHAGAETFTTTNMFVVTEIFRNRVFQAMRSAHPSEWLNTLDRDGSRNGHKALDAVIAGAARLHRAGVPLDQAFEPVNWREDASRTRASSEGPIAIRHVHDELNGTPT